MRVNLKMSKGDLASQLGMGGDPQPEVICFPGRWARSKWKDAKKIHLLLDREALEKYGNQEK